MKGAPIEAEPRPREGPGGEALLVLMLRTSKALVDRLRTPRPPGETSPMTAVHGLAAGYLSGRDDVTAGELARWLRVTKQSASEIVGVLERAGIVERAPHPSDRRARVLLLTDAGRAKLDEGRRRWQELEEEWVALVGRERLDVVRETLEAYLAADVPDEGEPTASD